MSANNRNDLSLNNEYEGHNISCVKANTKINYVNLDRKKSRAKQATQKII